MRASVCVVLFLASAVIANLVVAAYGQAALPFTAFLLVPFDLVTRDVLHDSWSGPGLWVRMAALIGAGALLTAAINSEAERVSLAGFVAFALAGITNTIAYGLLHRSTRWRRMNLSNCFAASTDSIVFPLIAFGTADPLLCVSQALSKVGGGLVFSWVAIAILDKRSLA